MVGPERAEEGSETDTDFRHKLLAQSEPATISKRIIGSITEDDSGSGAWFIVR
jgi:hypothetical protein